MCHAKYVCGLLSGIHMSVRYPLSSVAMHRCVCVCVCLYYAHPYVWTSFECHWIISNCRYVLQYTQHSHGAMSKYIRLEWNMPMQNGFVSMHKWGMTCQNGAEFYSEYMTKHWYAMICDFSCRFRLFSFHAKWVDGKRFESIATGYRYFVSLEFWFKFRIVWMSENFEHLGFIGDRKMFIVHFWVRICRHDITWWETSPKEGKTGS